MERLARASASGPCDAKIGSQAAGRRLPVKQTSGERLACPKGANPRAVQLGNPHSPILECWENRRSGASSTPRGNNLASLIVCFVVACAEATGRLL
jgi:hypothetical protein